MGYFGGNVLSLKAWDGCQYHIFLCTNQSLWGLKSCSFQIPSFFSGSSYLIFFVGKMVYNRTKVVFLAITISI